MPEIINDDDWDLLIERIKDGNCTPFLGAGACYGFIPLGSDIARDWAELCGYPFKDSYDDLIRVAQFLAIYKDPMYPKQKIIKQFQNVEPPNYDEPDEPHGLLADFRLPLYITTNYDNFMIEALKNRKCNPIKELCRWNSTLQKKPSVFDSSDFKLTSDTPVVYHLHGHLENSQSLVLTEDDYLDFLVNISNNAEIIPSTIQESFTKTSLLFLGYKLADINFRVLLRGLLGYLERSLASSHISVQLIPGGDTFSPEEKNKAREYLDKYFNKIDTKVYWGTCREFTKELRYRWEKNK